jgi:preprotein translocase subunit SecG
METFLLVIHVLTALALVGLILLQHGKGADVGAAFGSGASGSLFGASGSANFLSRTTAMLAVVFFVTSLGLTYFSSQKTESKGSVLTQPVQEKSLPSQIPSGAPAAPGKSAPSSDPASKAGDVPK